MDASILSQQDLRQRLPVLCASGVGSYLELEPLLCIAKKDPICEGVKGVDDVRLIVNHVINAVLVGLLHIEGCESRLRDSSI